MNDKVIVSLSDLVFAYLMAQQNRELTKDEVLCKVETQRCLGALCDAIEIQVRRELQELHDADDAAYSPEEPKTGESPECGSPGV